MSFLGSNNLNDIRNYIISIHNIRDKYYKEKSKKITVKNMIKEKDKYVKISNLKTLK